MSREPFCFDATYLHQTDAAVLVEYENEEFWIPRSQLLAPSANDLMGYERGDEAEFQVSEWIAREKGLL